jgi:hypothetical protein
MTTAMRVVPSVAFLVCMLATSARTEAREAAKAGVTVAGTGFRLDGEPFPYTGVSFFNAVFNREFNRSADARRDWIAKFKRYGINVLRLWGQWDTTRGMADAAPDATLYNLDGSLRAAHVATLKAIAGEAREQGVVVELALFSRQSWEEGIRLDDAAMDAAAAALARELMPYRNVTFQVWNEFDYRVADVYAVVKRIDPARLVTNSPGYAAVLGSDEENRLMDYLTPHTSRQDQTDGRPWEEAPREIALLVEKFKKPVVDDEPARNGTPNFGGPPDRTYPTDHILHIQAVRAAGGYPTYHHDMFQAGYGSEAVPPSGIPDPEFSPYHRAVFGFLALRERYTPPAEK